MSSLLKDAMSSLLMDEITPRVVKLKPQRKKQWVAALRSGEFLQGQGYLEQIDDSGASAFCCLGVACYLAEKEGVVTRARHRVKDWGNWAPGAVLEDMDGFWWNYGNTAGALPASVQEWLGAVNTMPYVKYKGRIVDLATLNDTEGLTFAQLADLIEEQL